MPRPIHFEIHADDPTRAKAFYEAMFGWTFSQWAGQEYWLIKTGESDQPGIDGGMIRRMGSPPSKGQPVNAYVCTVDVADLDASVRKATGSGGTIAVPRMAIPTIGWLAYVTDTEGNLVGMMESDPAAK